MEPKYGKVNTLGEMAEAYELHMKELRSDGEDPHPIEFVDVMWAWELEEGGWRLDNYDLAARWMRLFHKTEEEIATHLSWLQAYSPR